MKYCSDDGKEIFDTLEEYKKYEEKIKLEKESKEENERLKKQQADRIYGLWNRLSEIIHDYVNCWEEAPMKSMDIYSLCEYVKESENTADEEKEKPEKAADLDNERSGKTAEKVDVCIFDEPSAIEVLRYLWLW